MGQIFINFWKTKKITTTFQNIPEALNIENENERLKQDRNDLLDKIDKLQKFKDSVIYTIPKLENKPDVQIINPQKIDEPVIINENKKSNSFRDLNRGN